MVLMALYRVQGLDPERRQRAIERGLAWFLGHAGIGRRVGLVRRRQQPAHLQQHPVRRPRRPARPVHGGSDRTRPRAPGHPRRGPDAPRGAASASPSSGAPRPTTAPGTGAGASTTSTARGRCCAAWAPSARMLARNTSSARWRWLLSRQNADGGWGETLASYDDAELAGRGESIPSQTAWALLALFAVGHTERARGRARHPVPLRHAAAGRHLGGPALERHRLPARLLPQVPPVRQVLPALGPRRLSERPVVSGPGARRRSRCRSGAWRRSGASPSTSCESLGRFGRFLAQALGLVFVPPFKLGRLVDRIHFIGYALADPRDPDRRLHRHGARAADLPDAVAVRRRGLPRAGGRARPHPRAGPRPLRRVRHRARRLRPHRRDRDHAHHRADRRADGDGAVAHALPGGARHRRRRHQLPAHDRDLRRRRDLRRLPRVGGAPRPVRRARTSARCRPSSTSPTSWSASGSRWPSGSSCPGSAPTRAFTAATAPQGVARATTQAVVLSSVLILVCDYVLGSLLP